VGRRLPLLQRLRLLLNRRSGFAGGRRLLFRRASHLLCASLRFRRRAFSLECGAQDVIAALGEMGHFAAYGVQRFNHRDAGPRLGDGGFRGKPDGRDHPADVVLNRRGKALNRLGALLGHFREGPHLIGDDGEAAAVIASPRRFDSGIESKQVGLIGNATNRLSDLADVLSAPLQFANDLNGSLLAFGVAFDRPHRRRDLSGGLNQCAAHGFGVFAGPVRLRPSHAEVPDDTFDGRQLLLSATGRLIRAAGDLFHRPAQFFRGRGCLGETTRQFFGRRGNPFGDFVTLGCHGGPRPAAVGLCEPRGRGRGRPGRSRLFAAGRRDL